MASDADIDLEVVWLFAADIENQIPADQLTRCKALAPSWGSYRTWAQCGTNNVICHDSARAEDLVKRAWHAVCNLYIPDSVHQQVPSSRNLWGYDGQLSHAIADPEDIVALHLIPSADLICLVGFDLMNDPDRAGLVRAAIAHRPNIQFLVATQNDPEWSELSNLTCDDFANVLSYFT